MTKGHSTVMGITLADEYMAIEAAHFRNSENTNAAEGTGCTHGRISPSAT